MKKRRTPKSRPLARLQVLLEDNHLLVVNKPAQLPTMGVSDDRASVVTVAKEYIKQKYHKPGNVYLGVVSRLDAPVTGALLIARTSKAASRLSAQFRARQVEKIYWALVEGTPEVAGQCEHWLSKDERNRKVYVTRSETSGAQEARLGYRLLSRFQNELSLLEVTLETGRKHQIRVQLAAIGHPICGDRKYGSQVEFPDGIGLHSRQLRFEHPVRREPVTVTAPLPATWSRVVPDIET